MKESKDILSLFEALNNHEIFTPPRVARQMLDLIPSEVWRDPQARLLDPSTKSGVFLREAFYRFYEGLSHLTTHVGHDGKTYDLSVPQQRINHILRNMLYGIATSELTAYVARRTLYGVMHANVDKQIAALDSFEESTNFQKWTEQEKSNFIGRNKFNEYYDHRLFNTEDHKGFEAEGNIFYPNDEVQKIVIESDDYTIEDKYFPFIDERTKHKKILDIKGGKMKFDVIISNPPYQISDGGSGTGISAKPIYHYFVDHAISLNPSFISMIIPSRWFAGGKGLNDFRLKMLADKRLKAIVDFPNSKDCFSGVNIAGGVNYFLWSRTHNDACQVTNTVSGTSTSSDRMLDEFDVLIRDNIAATIITRLKNDGREFLSDQVLSRNPFNFDSKSRGTTQHATDSIKLIHSQGFGYVPRDFVSKNAEIIDLYKVTIGKVVPSNGEVDVTPEVGYRVITTPIIHPPGTIFTESYLLLGAFHSEEEAANFKYYITRKIPRYLMKQTLTSMNISKSNFDFVPKISWTEKWTDDSLVIELGLSSQEWAHINSVMRPIEDAS